MAITDNQGKRVLINFLFLVSYIWYEKVLRGAD